MYKKESLEFEYDVFFSYSTEPDYYFVREIETFIESFHRVQTLAKDGLRPLQACVDGSDFRLPTSRDWQRWGLSDIDRKNAVWQVIEENLSKSKYLLVFGSAAAATSEWVDREVQWFVENRGTDNILLAISETNQAQIDPSHIFPRSVVDHNLPEQTIWFDFRGRNKNLVREVKALRDYSEERVRLAGHLLDKSVSDLLPGWYKHQQQLEAESHLQNAIRSLGDKDLIRAKDELFNVLALTESNLARHLLAENIHASMIPRSQEFAAHGVTALAACGQNKVIIGDEAGYVRLLDLRNGWVDWSYELDSRILSISYDSQSGHIALGTETGSLMVLDSNTNQVEWSKELNVPVLGLRFSYSGALLAVGLGNDGGFIIFDQAGKTMMELGVHTGSIQGLAFNRDETHLYWGGSSQYIWYCEIGGACDRISTINEWVYSIDSSPDGRFSAVASGSEVHLFDHALQEHERLSGHSTHVYKVAFDPTGEYLLSGGADGTVKVWDHRARKLSQTVKAFEDEIYGLVVMDSVPVTVVSADYSGQIQTWQLQSHGIPVSVHHFRPTPWMLTRPQRNQIVDLIELDNKHLLIKTWDGKNNVIDLTTRLWVENEIDAGSFTQALAAWRARASYHEPAPFMWDYQSIWSESFATIPSLISIDRMFRNNDVVYALSPDGNYLATVSGDGTWILESKNGKTLRGSHTIEEPISVAFINDLAIMISGKGGKIVVVPSQDKNNDETGIPAQLDPITHILFDQIRQRVLSISTRGDLKVMLYPSGVTVFQHRIPGLSSLAMSPNGRWLATAAIDGNVSLRDPDSGDKVISFSAHRGPVNVIGFSADNKFLFSGGFDETVRLWNVNEVERLLDAPQGLLVEVYKKLH